MTYRSRFFSSFSTASRMNSARLFGPATASILSGTPAGSLTTVGLTLAKDFDYSTSNHSYYRLRRVA